jgi:hypothetical protein
MTDPGAAGGCPSSGVGLVREAARRAVYDFVVITLTRVPNVIVIMAAVVLSYLVYRRRSKPPSRSCCWGYCSLPLRDTPGWIPPEVRLRRVPGKHPGGAGGSVRGLGAVVGATSIEEDTSHPRPWAARRPAYRRWLVAQGFQCAL